MHSTTTFSQRTCNNCTTETTCWRRIDGVQYCNKCALYLRAHKQQRPANPRKTEHAIYETSFDHFDCQICQRRYSHLNTLKQHCSKQHDKQGWQYKYLHVKSVRTRASSYQCPYCVSKCATEVGLQRHLKKKHVSQVTMEQELLPLWA